MGYLDNVPEDKVFILGDKKLKNIEDLLNELKSISDETYSYYASEKHNYFADWVMHVIKHDKLAADLINAGSNKNKAISALENHINKLKNKKKPSKPKNTAKETVIETQVKKESPETDPIIQETLKKPIKKEVSVQKKTEKVVSTEKPDHEYSIHEIEDMLEKVSKEDVEIRNIIWKHFKWELAKEFMYGMAIGILMGIILSKLFMP